MDRFPGKNVGMTIEYTEPGHIFHLQTKIANQGAWKPASTCNRGMVTQSYLGVYQDIIIN